MDDRSSSQDTVYIFADGDGIGDRMEALVRARRLDEAGDLSVAITEAIRIIGTMLRDRGAYVVFAGGDDVLVRVARTDAEAAVNDIRRRFEMLVGSAMSAGVSTTPEGAVEALRRAKDLGRNCIKWI